MPTIVNTGHTSPPLLTLLWSNPSPSSNFGQNTVTLGQSTSNFDALRIVYKINASDSIDQNEYLECPVDRASDRMGYIKYFDVNYCRLSYLSTDTSMVFDRALQVLGSNYAEHILIPVYIYGVKYIPNSGIFDNVNVEVLSNYSGACSYYTSDDGLITTAVSNLESNTADKKVSIRYSSSDLTYYFTVNKTCHITIVANYTEVANRYYVAGETFSVRRDNLVSVCSF